MNAVVLDNEYTLFSDFADAVSSTDYQELLDASVSTGDFSFAIQTQTEDDGWADLPEILLETAAVVEETPAVYGPSTLEQCFSKSIEEGGSRRVVSLIRRLTQSGYSTDKLATSWTLSMLNECPSSSDAVSRWKDIAYATTSMASVNCLWEYILSRRDCDAETVGRVLHVSSRLQHPSSIMGQLICSLVKMNRMELATSICSKTSIPGNYFNSPLMKLAAERDVVSIERLANLLAVTLVAETKRHKKGRKESEEKTVPLADEQVLTAVYAYFSRPRVKKVWNPTKKRHRVNEDALFGILKNIRNRWYYLATDQQARERCRDWCSQNNINFEK